jgi:hypothetical protein
MCSRENCETVGTSRTEELWEPDYSPNDLLTLLQTTLELGIELRLRKGCKCFLINLALIKFSLWRKSYVLFRIQHTTESQFVKYWAKYLLKCNGFYLNTSTVFWILVN